MLNEIDRQIAASLVLGLLGASGWYAVSRAARQHSALFAAMLPLEERVGFYEESGIGLPGRALPASFNDPKNYITVRAHFGYLATVILVLLGAIAGIWL